jgi:hypothetical protein
MKTKFLTILTILFLSINVSADGGGHGHDEQEETATTISKTADLFDATIASLQAFKSQNPDEVVSFGAIRSRVCNGKVETQIKTKDNDTFSYKCHGHPEMECHEETIDLECKK